MTRARTKKLLEMLLIQFQNGRKARKRRRSSTTRAVIRPEQIEETQGRVTRSLITQIVTALGKSNTIGPGGRSILEERYVNLGIDHVAETARLGELQQQLTMAEMMPKFEFDPEASGRAARIAELNERRKRMTRSVSKICESRSASSTAIPRSRELAGRSTTCSTSWKSLQRRSRRRQLSTPTEMIIEQYNREMDADREEHDKLLAEMQKSIPEHQRILAMLKDREERDKADRPHERQADGVRHPEAAGREQPVREDSRERRRADGCRSSRTGPC